MQEEQLMTTFSSGYVGGIQVPSFTISTNGGSNGIDDGINSNSGHLSKLLIIIITFSVLIILGKFRII
jgi:hypothetical protein